MGNARSWTVTSLVMPTLLIASQALAQPVQRSQPVFVRPPTSVPPARAARTLPANPRMAIPRAPAAQPAPVAPSTAHELTHVQQQESRRAQSVGNALGSRDEAGQNAVGNVK
jgi:hypothetical protein